MSEQQLPPQIEKTDQYIDLIEEIRLRTWARRNYRRPEERDSRWHPVIHDEMKRKDAETAV